MATYDHMTSLKNPGREVNVESANRDGEGKNIANNYAKQNGYYSTLTAGLAEGIATDRTIDNPEDSCPAITFGTVGGEAEIQTGINKFQTLFGNSRKWNQLANRSESYSVSCSAGGEQYSGNAFGASFTFAKDTIVLLSYEQSADISNETARNMVLVASDGLVGYFTKLSGDVSTTVISATTKGMHYFLGKVKTTTFSNKAIGYWIRTPNVDVSVSKLNIHNLTAIYGAGNEPTTVDEFIKDYPAPYYPYNESAILSSKSASLISRGFNQWDEEWELGYWNKNTGGKNNSSDNIRSKNYIRVIPGETYYFTAPDNLNILYYDANKNYLGTNNQGNNRTYTMAQNCHYITFYTVSTYGTTYNHDICIFFHWDDTRNGEYVPYRSQTVTLPNIELRSVPNYADPANPIRDVAYQIGGGKRRVGRYTFTGNETVVNWGNGVYAISTIGSVVKGAPTNQIKPNISMTSLDVVPSGSASLVEYAVTVSPQIHAYPNFLLVHITSSSTEAEVKAYLAGKVVEYELATETDIPLTENPGWVELVYTDNWGTLEFTTDPVQNPQVPQPYFIEYTISLTEWVDSAYTRTDGDANNIATEEELDAIRGGNDVVGKAKLADNLESNNKTALLSAYVFEQSPTGKADSMLLDKIVGGDVAFNQLFKNLIPTETVSGITFTKVDEKKITIAGTATSRVSKYVSTDSGGIPVKTNHVYLIKGMEANSQNIGLIFNAFNASGYVTTYSGKDIGAGILIKNTVETVTILHLELVIENGTTLSKTYSVTPQVFDLTQMFGSAIANYLYNLETATSGAGVNKFRLLFPKAYYPYNAGELLPVRTVGRKAVGVNQWDEEWELGNIGENSGQNQDNNTVIRSKNYIAVIPNTTYYFKISNLGVHLYYYDAQKTFISHTTLSANTTWTIPANCYYIRFVPYTDYGTTYKNDICINLSDPSINGTFYPYVENTYPVEDVKLHGVFKLNTHTSGGTTIIDDDNPIVTDGDEYTPDGKVLRKYGIVDFATLNWTYNNTYHYWQTVISGMKDRAESLCPNFTKSGWSTVTEVAGTYFIDTDGQINVNNGSSTTTPTGTLNYELATPTEDEETHSTYASTQVKGTTQQWLEPEWTEEETPIMVPVGNQATLFDDLKKKVEIAADMPANDGTYVLNKSGGNSTFTPLETWLGNNGYNKMQVLSDVFGTKEALGGTLKQLLSSTKNIAWENLDYLDLSTLQWEKGSYGDVHIGYYATCPQIKRPEYGQTANMIASNYVTLSSSGTGWNRKGIMMQYSGSGQPYLWVYRETESDPLPTGLLAYEKASS